MKYTTINHEARKKLNLSWMEYGLADTIYHLSNNPKKKGWCYASKNYLAATLGITPRAIFKMLNRLEIKGLIERQANTQYLRVTKEWYSEVVISTTPRNYEQSSQSRKMVNKVHTDGEQSSQSPISRNSEQSSYNKEYIKSNKEKDDKYLRARKEAKAARDALIKRGIIKE